MEATPVASWLFMLIIFAVFGLLVGGAIALGTRIGRSRRRAIPREELTALVQAREEAERLAAAGDAPGGYAALAAGRERADQLLWAREPWARELKGQWHAAAEEFAQDHPLTPRPELVPAAPPEATGREVSPISSGG